ncbi:major capsid protein [Sagittula sp.]|uniref:major capsid protein n=1 Tax=Sagittula sp. TaxID=2038081 RepID=UPI003517E814
MFLFDTAGFNATQLTTRANDAKRFPFMETLARRLYSVNSITGHTAQIDREKFGVQILGSTARGTTAQATASQRSRNTFPVNSVKIGDRAVVTPAQMDGVRMTGLQAGAEISLETMENLVDKELTEKFGNMDYTLEYLCVNGLKGQFIDPEDDSVVADYPDLFGVDANPVVDLKLWDTTDHEMGALRARYHTALKNSRAGLGNVEAKGYVALNGGGAWENLQAHPELRDAFKRKDDGSFLSSSSFDSVRAFGIEHVEYRGPGLGANEVIIVPLGIPGMLEIDFASGDKLGFTNMPGEARYVIPKNNDNPFQDFGEGAEWEVSSCPIIKNSRPEAVQVCTGGEAPAE